MKKFAHISVIAAGSLALAACGGSKTATAIAEDAIPAVAADPITAVEVETAQINWGEGIVAIGEVFTAGGDYRQRAAEHIEQFYGYGEFDTILFKPTLAAQDQFRETSDQALSYFVGTEGSEDKGFAIAPYTAVRWENNGIIVDPQGDTALAMGNYFFTGTNGKETKVEYSFAYEKDDAGDLKIILHHSSLPFDPS